MGFEISVCLFSIDAASFSPVESNIKAFLDKSLLDTGNFFMVNPPWLIMKKTYHIRYGITKLT